MVLKAVTTVALLVGFSLLLLFAVTISRRPAMDAPVAARREYSRLLQVQLGGMLGAMVVSGGGAILIMRRVRKEYQDLSRRNLQTLIEGTLDDHRKKSPDA